MSQLKQATAQAQPNIALVKYWGKRDRGLNLPVGGSISITLDSLWTRTRVSFDSELDTDELLLNEEPAPQMLPRVSASLDRVRDIAGTAMRARVDTFNNFPTGAGLASSASGFAALVVAAGTALGLQLEDEELSVLARRGSGSAARSIFGGFVEMAAGRRADGTDAAASPLIGPRDWPLEVAIAITSEASKAVGSTDGMQHTAATAPYYEAWVSSIDGDLADARAAIEARDFEALAAVSEHSCLKMHALAMSARPGLVYWNGPTVECLSVIRNLRSEGTPVFFTIDAGPQVKAIHTAGAGDRVVSELMSVPGVTRVLRSGLGEGARIIETGLGVTGSG